jgi:hypothetical protein
MDTPRPTLIHQIALSFADEHAHGSLTRTYTLYKSAPSLSPTVKVQFQTKPSQAESETKQS